MATRATTKPRATARKPAAKRASQPAPKQDAQVARKDLGAMVRMLYDAGGNGRRMRSWNPPATGPNRAMFPVSEKLRSRSRDSVRNDWASKSASQKLGTTLIGIGITPRFKNVTNETRRNYVTKLFKRWSSVADADWAVGDVYGMQTLGVREWFDGGEVFIRARGRDDNDYYPVNIQFQLLPSEMLPFLDSDSQQGMPDGNIIRSGIEFNKYGRRVAYWFYKQHPGDAALFDADISALVRVRAADVSHCYTVERAGQIRGVSALSTILARLRTSADYEDAVLERQKLANLFVAFIKKTLPEYSELDTNHLGDPLQTDLLDGGDAMLEQPKVIMPMEPGATIELAEGEDMQFANPPEAGTMFSEYMRTTGLGTSAGLNLPYELHTGDIQNISDRTLRILMNEYRRHAEQLQWQIIIPKICQFMIDKWTDAAVLDGLIGVNEAEQVRDVEHAPHGWAYIHPVQDVQGKALEVSNGFRSRSSVIAEKGDDPIKVDQERAADQERAKELGIVDPLAQPAPNDPQDPEDPESGKPGQ